MPESIEVATQADLDRIVREHPDARLIVRGDGWFHVRGTSHVEAWGRSRVVAWGRSHVEAWGRSHVVARDASRVEAWGRSHVVAWGRSRVVAWESSRVVAWGHSHVVAWESSHVVASEHSHVEAREHSHVEAWDASRVEASPLVAVHQHSDRAAITGGVVIPVRLPTTAVDWCAYYGVPVTDGIATLYKAVRDDYRSSHGLRYEPGTTVEATDWDGGRAECGGGLHFSPHPAMALAFEREATRFLACPVALADMRPPSAQDRYPQKIKARAICAPIVEVDRRGRPLAASPARPRATREAAS